MRDVSLQIDRSTAFRPIETPTEGLLWPTRALDRSKLRSHQTTKGDRLRLRAGYVLPYTGGEPPPCGCVNDDSRTYRHTACLTPGPHTLRDATLWVHIAT